MLRFNLNRKRSRFRFDETLASGRYRSRLRNRVTLSAGSVNYVIGGKPHFLSNTVLGLGNNVLDLSACFPTGTPCSSTHSLSGAADTFAKAFAFMFHAAVVAPPIVAAMPDRS